jgi:hypothetical protein
VHSVHAQAVVGDGKFVFGTRQYSPSNFKEHR